MSKESIDLELVLSWLMHKALEDSNKFCELTKEEYNLLKEVLK